MAVGEKNPIYLDHNATTPVDPEVSEAILPWLREDFGNPSSSHSYGRRAKAAVDHAREQVSGLLGCRPEEIFFTSCGTESNNLALLGVSEAITGNRKGIVTSAVEHPSVARPCERLQKKDWNVLRLPVDAQGAVFEEDLGHRIDTNTALLTVMHGNNETGTVMPVRRLTEAARGKGALVHTDAAQSAGKIRVRVDELGVDLLSVAGHKVYAPKGIGALYVRRGTPIEPVLFGAGHEGGLRPGTENVPYIVGLGRACEIAAGRLTEDAERITALRDLFWDLLRTEISGIRLNGHPTERLPNTLNVSFPGVRGGDLLAAAETIAASTGSACHEGGGTPSEVLLAMGLDPDTAMGSVRLSLGRWTTDAQVREAAQALIHAWGSLYWPK
mgnify:CR=1 FL=1